MVSPRRPRRINIKRHSSIRTSIGTSVEGKGAPTKEPMDISSGKSKDSYHGCPIEEEEPKEETTITGAHGTTSSKEGVLETKILGESKEVSVKYTHVQTSVKKTKLKKSEIEEKDLSVENTLEDRAVTPPRQSRVVTLP